MQINAKRAFVLGLFFLSATFSGPVRAEQPMGQSCTQALSETKTQMLYELLKSPSLTARDAIAAIVKYLAHDIHGTGPEKHKIWSQMVSRFNDGRTNTWINAPCAKTARQDIVCWGETRGHLLVFEHSGLLFKSFNPERANPIRGQDGFVTVPWEDPTLKQVL